MKILYSENNTEEFNMERFLNSLKPYGEVKAEDVEALLAKDYQYDPLHYSCLVEIGARLIPDAEKAKEYWDAHTEDGQGFERLARITGYLVGSLDRWNSGKRAEWAERYSHPLNGQFSPDEKDEIERKKRIVLNMEQDEYRKI